MPRDVYAETAFGLPPGPMPMATCRCGAIYRDNESGWDEHDVVFGHRPVQTGGGHESLQPAGTKRTTSGSDARASECPPPHDQDCSCAYGSEDIEFGNSFCPVHGTEPPEGDDE